MRDRFLVLEKKISGGIFFISFWQRDTSFTAGHFKSDIFLGVVCKPPLL